MIWKIRFNSDRKETILVQASRMEDAMLEVLSMRVNKVEFISITPYSLPKIVEASGQGEILPR